MGLGGFNIRHGNRSQQGLVDSQGQRAAQVHSASQSIATTASSEDKAYEARSTQPQPYPTTLNDERQSYLPANSQGNDLQTFQDPSASDPPPARSQSHRYTSGYAQPAPPHHIGDNQRTSLDDQVVVGDLRKSYSVSGNIPARQPALAPAPVQAPAPPAEQKKSSTARFFKSFSSKAKDQTSGAPQSESSHGKTLGRSASKRQKDTPPALRAVAQAVSERQQQQQQQQSSAGWQSGQSSESQLASPREGDEDEIIDPYSAREPEHHIEQSPIQSQGYDPRGHPTIRLPHADQDPGIRLVEESPTQVPFLGHHQQLAQQQQRLAQRELQYQQVQGQVSAENLQQGDYQSSMQHPAQYQVQQGPTGQLYTNIPYRQNPEVISQLSHDSPTEQTEDQRPPSATQSQTPGGLEYPPRSASISQQGGRPAAQPSNMPPPSASNSQNRRSTDAKSALSGESRGAPPGYSQQFSGQSQGNSGGPNPLPPIPGAAPASANYRAGSALQREYGQPGAGEQGRNTPPPPSADRDLTDMDKLVIKYKKVKGLYFERQAQVEALQNTLANQRLSQSRTIFDDNEYVTRFNRLDGAIKEIAFSIRKDWKSIPSWLAPYVNADAQKTGTKEMTAVGRACISRWIYEEIFLKCFHPGLDPILSTELKRIEQNIRFHSQPNNQEEADALTARVVQWKLTTIDGLGHLVHSANSLEIRAAFIKMAVSNLTTHLLNHLQDVASQGIEGNAQSIIELAVGIATNLPLESRDIAIIYPLPRDIVQQSCMKVEPPLPPLDLNGPDDQEGSSTNSDPKDSLEEKTDGGKLTKKQDKTKLGPGGSNGKKMGGTPAPNDGPSEREKMIKDGAGRVRFAGFMGVEVRGRQWLVSSPVWTIS